MPYVLVLPLDGGRGRTQEPLPAADSAHEGNPTNPVATGNDETKKVTMVKQ
jgi:hypothetical protein